MTVSPTAIHDWQHTPNTTRWPWNFEERWWSVSGEAEEGSAKQEGGGGVTAGGGEGRPIELDHSAVRLQRLEQRAAAGSALRAAGRIGSAVGSRCRTSQERTSEPAVAAATGGWT